MLNNKHRLSPNIFLNSFSFFFFIFYFLFIPPVFAAPQITNISDNRASYTNSQIPKYEKLEINFHLQTVAQNLQWPLDTSPPAGIASAQGINVDAIFTSPSGKIFSQPAFYFQPFAEDSSTYRVPLKNGRDWLYAEGQAFWKIRFSPNENGNWQYKIKAQDAAGISESVSNNFTVSNNLEATDTKKGFIRAGKNDSRYFEWEDGTYFPSLGYNMNFDHISWKYPISDNQENFQKMGQNHIQLVRLWLSEWSIFGAEWNPWHSEFEQNQDWYYLDLNKFYPGHDNSMYITAGDNNCMANGYWPWGANLAVKPNTAYRLRFRIKTNNLTGPKTAGQPWGFVVKTDAYGACANNNSGRILSDYVTANNSDWTSYVSQKIFTTANDEYFLIGGVILALENVAGGSVYVDEVTMEEVVNAAQNQYGPNIISKPSMNHLQYFDQRQSYAFDKVLELAKDNNVYLRPVVLEKNDILFDQIDRASGGWSGRSNDNFYGEYKTITKARWLQQAWWRYLQARWGYSPHIQSWELLNEGDPNSGRHAIMTDEFAKFMHCRVFGVGVGSVDGDRCSSYENPSTRHPNAHMSSTSNWTNYPSSFWNACPNCDFTDYHRYIKKDLDGATYYDSALATYDFSINKEVGLEKPQLEIKRPIIRGETGFVDSGTQPGTRDLMSDTKGVWLHNFLWGGINSGGMIESYWYENYDDYGHIYSPAFDFRPEFKKYFDFIKNVPLNNGQYIDAAAAAPAGIRAWGQKDLSNKRAHLWIANASYRWNNQNPTGVSGAVQISGFTPNTSYKVETWDTYAGAVSTTTSVTADAAGNLNFSVNNLTKDYALKIGDYSANSAPLHCAPLGDIDCSGTVNTLDFVYLISKWGTTDAKANLNDTGLVDSADLKILLGKN